MAIRVVRNNNGNCITFVGSSQPAYWNACLSAQINDGDANRIDVINDVRTTDPDDPLYEFYAVPYTEFQDEDGNSFSSAAEAAEYITEKANVLGGAITLDANTTVDFTRDNTLTSIITSLGDSFAVNGIKASVADDGTITIAENTSTGTNIYVGLRHNLTTINGQSAGSSSAAVVVNALNSFFTVTPVGAGADDIFDTFTYAIQTPTVTAFGDVTITSGVATKGSNSNSQFNDGFFTADTHIDTAGEYFYFNNNGEDFDRKFIIGLLETSRFGDVPTTLESITTSGTVLDLAVRFKPNASYENADTGVVIENGFYERPGNSQIFRAGIRSDERLIIEHLKDGEWQTIVRSAFPRAAGSSYQLVCHLNKENATADVSSVRTYSLSTSVTLNYRYIESPDGSFHYPLFSTRAEADYVSQNANTIFGTPYVNDTTPDGDGFYSTTQIYVDEPTNTTWYMPVEYAFTDQSSAPVDSNGITYSGITTEDDANYAPATFTSSDFTFGELAAVNIQIHPADANFTTSVSGLPPCLNYSIATGYITGTTDPIPEDESHIISVTRSNTYGSTVGTFTINITDNASLGDLADFTELDGNFYQPNRLHLSHDFAMKYNYTLSPSEELTFTINASSGISGLGSTPPDFGILSTSGDSAFDHYDSAGVALGSTGYDFAQASMWDLRVRTKGSSISNMVGFSDNTALSGTSNENVGPVLKLEYDSADGYIRLYRGSSLLKTSASTFTGAQTITMVGLDDQFETDLFVPTDLSIQNSYYGSTQPPSGFVNPLLEGDMATKTLMGTDSDEDAAVQLTQALPINHRMIFPQTWTETNVLPYSATDQSNKAFIGIPTSGADFTDVGETDFDAYFKIQGTSSTVSYQSRINTGSGGTSTEESVTINSLTDAYYDYAIEWDDSDLHIIACNIGDINTQPAVSRGGSFSRTKTTTNYSGSGDLDVVIGVDEGAQVNLSTSGVNVIRIPFGINDIMVAENSNGTGEFKVQPAAAAYDAHDGGHRPSGYGFAYAGVTTLNAGTTYRFIYHPSMEADDKIEFRLASDNTTVYTTGVTTFGSGDPSSTSAYKGIEFAVPADAPPLTLYYYNSFASAYDAGRAVSISGSTYVASVTGITLEGPAANQTGTNVMDQYDHGWISVDEQLSAGERLVLDNAFFADFLAEAMDTNNIFAIGLKGDNWTNTKEVNNQQAATSGEFFKGNSYIVGVCSSGGTQVTMSIISNGSVGNSMLMNSTSLFGTACAFIDITSSGNNIRMGFGRNGNLGVTQGDESTVAYADWNSYKGQTGDQGYGITSIDVVMSFWTYDGGDIDGNEIDWTGLSEVSVPTPAATLTTNWNKALDFSGSSERTQQVNSSYLYNPLNMGNLSTTVAAPTTSGYTSNDTNARPWATTCVFKVDGNASNQHIWNNGEGAGSTDDNVYLRVDANRNLYFGFGRAGALNELDIASSLSTSSWYGLYIAHTGERLSGANATAANLADCFDVRLVDLSTGVVGSNLCISSNWSNTGGRMDRQFTGSFTIGGRGSNRNFHGKVAGMVSTTLMRNVAMPDATEITKMVRDPIQWLTDYKVGNSYRRPSVGTVNTNFQLNTLDASYGTQVWLMGDGTGDAYAQIRNQVYPGTQNNTPMNMISMLSSDIETVTITGLT